MNNIQPFLFMLMNSLKTDNSNFQILSLFILFIPLVIKFIPIAYIKNIYIDYFDNKWSKIIIPSHNILVYRGYNNSKTMKTFYSNNFLSIIYYLITINKTDLKSLTEVLTYDFCDFDMTDKTSYFFFPIQNKKILIENDIYIQLSQDIFYNEDNNNNNNKNDINDNKTNYNITLYTPNNIKTLQDFILKCSNLYDQYNISKNFNKKYIFTFQNSQIKHDKLELLFKQDILCNNKDLKSNIFFENKNKLIDYIDPFIFNSTIINDNIQNEQEMKYFRSGYTFKASLLFYGLPGCGKTSTIKAILNYTNRHGIVIDISKIKTCDELETIFSISKINNIKLTNKQKCFIFEDFDAQKNSLLESRDLKNESINSDIDVSNNLNILNLINKHVITCSDNKNENNNNNLNLSCFLNILDGIIEHSGIMIIFTSNFPEKIDKALLRPGRIDFKYEFKNASKNIIKEMVKFKFNLTQEQIDNAIDNIYLPDYILSPAIIQNICFKYKNVEYIECINEIFITSNELINKNK